MKILLAILCVIVILFSSYWILNSSAVMAVVFMVIAGLNILLLVDLYGMPGRFRGIYRLLAGADGMGASALTVITAFQAQQGDAIDPVMIAVIAALVVKAILTRWLMAHPEAA